MRSAQVRSFVYRLETLAIQGDSEVPENGAGWQEQASILFAVAVSATGSTEFLRLIFRQRRPPPVKMQT